MTFQLPIDKNSFQFQIIFLGMNPVKDDAANRIKANIKDMRIVYLDLDRNADESVQAIRNSVEVPPPNFVVDTSPASIRSSGK
jgi:hypothetical protein